jgi:hypothetical protein
VRSYDLREPEVFALTDDWLLLAPVALLCGDTDVYPLGAALRTVGDTAAECALGGVAVDLGFMPFGALQPDIVMALRGHIDPFLPQFGYFLGCGFCFDSLKVILRSLRV